jgi:nitrous oxidase accessory protein
MRKTFASLLVLLLPFSVVLVSFPRIDVVKADQKTIVVPDDYVSIQEAIDAAAGGDTVYVKSGIYHENVGINKPVSLIGEDRNETVIDEAPEEGHRIPVSITCDNVTVSGFTLRYGYSGMQMDGVKHCVISGNSFEDSTFGIRCLSSSSNNITDNIFESIGLGSAIRLELATHNFVNKNYVNSCVEGIQLMQSANYNSVSENTILDCNDVGIRLQDSDWNMVTRNIVKDSGCGISVYIANNNDVQQNIFINNSIEVGADEWYARQWGYGYSLNSWKNNYYSDYNGTDNDGDGIGDTPYIINEKNQDNYPLVNPEIIPEFPSWAPLLIALVAVVAITFVYRHKLNKQRRFDDI